MLYTCQKNATSRQNAHFPKNSNTKAASSTKRLFKTYNNILYICYTIQQYNTCMANNNQNNNNLIKKNRTTVITIRVAVPNSNRQTFSSQPTNIYTAHIHAGCFNSSWHIPSDTNKQSGSHCFTSNCNQQPTPNVSNSNHLAFHIPTQGNLVLVPIGNHLKKPLANNPSRTRFCTNQQPTGKPSHSSSKRLCLRREYCKIAPAMPQKK